LVCFNCIPQWTCTEVLRDLHRSTELDANDRQKAERELRQWLVSYHHADVIQRSKDLPKPEQLLMKLVTGCGQCDACGKTPTGARCSYCDEELCG